MPTQYPIRHYPDITHTRQCQYPVPDWDVAFAVTEGRKCINPRPEDMAAIFRHTQPFTIGFLTYSEGCNDDLNKTMWSALGWNPEAKVIDIPDEGAGVPRRVSWMDHAETLHDTPLRMRYTGLDPKVRYKLHVVYGGDSPKRMIRLVANDTTMIHPFIPKPVPFAPIEFALPPSVSASGELNLSWFREPGLGGNGRGCQVSEVWLIKDPSPPAHWIALQRKSYARRSTFDHFFNFSPQVSEPALFLREWSRRKCYAGCNFDAGASTGLAVLRLASPAPESTIGHARSFILCLFPLEILRQELQAGPAL